MSTDKLYAIISDIHGNEEAFRNCMAYIKGLAVDEIYCLGDLVGYGQGASYCVDLARKNNVIVWGAGESGAPERGLPQAIRTDNGAPFASTGLGGLSRLSAWFIKLGIRPERIAKAHPEQNGRHERMHRTLKESTAMPPQASLIKQQKAFNDFVYEYNFDRPHEALGMEKPGAVYAFSE